MQTLQFTVKDPTVGKAATFVKVDHVIQETKNLMNIISKVVATCFDCANKVSIDYRHASLYLQILFPHYTRPLLHLYLEMNKKILLFILLIRLQKTGLFSNCDHRIFQFYHKPEDNPSIFNIKSLII